MSKQNIYDNETFFNEYKHLRSLDSSANILIEKPALFSLVPDLNGKKILDLGCGYGENCKEFLKLGARKVVGVDISQKMLDIAEIENKEETISYINLSMEEIEQLNETFDVVTSSLAFHYIKEFDTLVKNIYNLLNPGGHLIFSQENPINTCFSSGSRWTKDEEGNVVCANLYQYSMDGKRLSKWFVDDVIKYHRTFSSIINSLVTVGFRIEKMLEPIPSEEVMNRYPAYKKDIHKPDFWLIKVCK
jgi:2-polyprenyl-3-methyl-5-hydroxy-6-metoxy-1,4-benzoquinol methylase